MLSLFSSWLKGAVALLLMLFSTLFWFPLLLLLAFVKLLIPIDRSRRLCTVGLMGIAEIWIGINNLIIRTLTRTQWDIRGLEGLSRREWYLVACNHQSWADILVVQYALNRRIPLLKFFLKQQLIWIPFLGIAWWALDFPFMQRHTKAQLEKHPHLRGKDLETTRRACEKFRTTPVAIFNFLEGTRFTPAKHRQQNSPYRHLLRPRAGGTAFVLGAMGDQLHTMLDITLLYPDGRKRFWDLVCGRISRIIVDIRTLDIPLEFRGRDYATDPEFKENFQQWVSQLWAAKDKRIEELVDERCQ